MITVWTIMVITFGAGPFEGVVTGLPYRDAKACGDHIMVMREQMEAQGLVVSMVQCKPLNRLSASIRPEPRP